MATCDATGTVASMVETPRSYREKHSETKPLTNHINSWKCPVLLNKNAEPSWLLLRRPNRLIRPSLNLKQCLGLVWLNFVVCLHTLSKDVHKLFTFRFDFGLLMLLLSFQKEELLCYSSLDLPLMCYTSLVSRKAHSDTRWENKTCLVHLFSRALYNTSLATLLMYQCC